MDLLQRLQLDTAGRIKADSYFADVPVYVSRPRDAAEAVAIQNSIDSALAGLIEQGGKSGIAVIVFIPECRRDPSAPDAPGPRLMVVLTCRVIENPLVNEGANGTGKTAEDCALTLHNLLHQAQFPGYLSGLVSAPEAITPTGNTGRIELDCKWEARCGLTPPTRATAPVITGTSAAVTLTTATNGAAIYYSTDESYPSAAAAAFSVPTATLYTVPFTVASGTVVRAAAEKSGLQQSFVTRAVMG